MFAHAPAPLAVGGLLAVPIHVRQLKATVTLDAQDRHGHVDAVLSYQVGPTSGCSLFDLRQSIDEAWLDGRCIGISRMRPWEVGEGPYATMRVLDVPQAAHSIHTLRLRYCLGQPHSDLGGAYPPVLSARGYGRLRWSFGMADLFDGRHLEMWFPSNLPFDRFPFELAVTLTGAASNHTVITNGGISARGLNSWRISFPAWFSSVSPMVELRPADELEHAHTQVVLGRSGRKVAVDVWKAQGRPEDLANEAARIGRLINANEAEFGSFPSQRYRCLFHGAEGGMEYAGATTTSPSALAHEVLHSWFARGVTPASDADGWWDEAFTTYVTSGTPVTPLDFGRPPMELCSRRPFQRHTHPAAYVEGSRLFSGIAEITGEASLRRAMRRLFLTRRGTGVSTAELEQHLVVDTGAVEIVDAFHRFVYGFDDCRRGCRVRLDRLWISDGPAGTAWINALLGNEGEAEVCHHYLVLFSVSTRRAPAGSHAPTRVTAVGGFDLRPGQARVVRAQVPIRAIRPSAGTAGIDIIAGVHARRSHPSGEVLDYQERTMMQTAVRPAGGARGPSPAILSVR